MVFGTDRSTVEDAPLETERAFWAAAN